MLKTLGLVMLCGCVLLIDGPVEAQQPKLDCKNAQTQTEMTHCSGIEFDTADKALNSQYQISRRIMKKWDADAIAEQKGADDALVKAQRAWVAYRDSQCTSYGFQAHGGTMEPQLVYDCQADLTRKRIAELKELTDMMN